MPQAESVALPKRLPLVVQPDNRGETTDQDARLVNAYMEKDKSTGEYHLYKRPGLSQTGATLSGNGYGVFNWLGDIYAIFGATMYKNGVALAGALNTAGGVYRFSQSLGGILRLQFGNGLATYNYDSVAGIVQISGTSTVNAISFVQGINYTILVPGTTNFMLVGAANNLAGTNFTATNLGDTYAGLFTIGLTYVIVSPGTTVFTAIGAANNIIGTIFVATGVGAGTGIATGYSNGTGTATTTSNFPATVVKGIAYLDGTTYVMNSDASIRGCAIINDTTNWSDTLNRITAQIEADGGVFLAHQLVYLIAIGQWSTEVFYDALNAVASPLGPVQGAKINYGCVNQDSVQEIDGVLFWLATNRSAAVQVIMVEQLKPQIVSDASIERLLGEADFSSVYSFGIKFEGHRFYGFTLLNANLTLVYDLTERLWSQWTDTNGNYWPVASTTYSSAAGRIIQHATNGKLYTLTNTATTEDGAILPVDIYTPNFDGGTRRGKQLNMIEFCGDKTPGSVLQVRYNDDDYDPAKWSNFRRVDMGLKKPMLPSNGKFQRRAYHIRHQAATRLRLTSIDLQIDLCTL